MSLLIIHQRLLWDRWLQNFAAIHRSSSVATISIIWYRKNLYYLKQQRRWNQPDVDNCATILYRRLCVISQINLIYLWLYCKCITHKYTVIHAWKTVGQSTLLPCYLLYSMQALKLLYISTRLNSLVYGTTVYILFVIIFGYSLKFIRI